MLDDFDLKVGLRLRRPTGWRRGCVIDLGKTNQIADIVTTAESDAAVFPAQY
jgi:hypothetical protein